jgi:hypothetical protein
METTIKRNRYLKLPAELYERLQAARGSRSWPDFIAELEVKLKLTRDRNPHKFYFDKNLAAMGLTKDDVCWLCQRRSAQPVPLVPIDYLDLTFDIAHQEGLTITKEEIGVRFNLAGIVPQAPGCPTCRAFEGRRRLENLIDEILPERSGAIMKSVYASKLKCNTALQQDATIRRSS